MEYILNENAWLSMSDKDSLAYTLRGRTFIVIPAVQYEQMMKMLKDINGVMKFLNKNKEKVLKSMEGNNGKISRRIRKKANSGNKEKNSKKYDRKR